MKVINLAVKPPLSLIILIFQNPDRLPQVAINILYPPLALPIVDDHLNTDHLVRKVQDLIDIGLNLHVIVRFEAREAAGVLHIALEVELLLGQALDCLALN